MRRPRPRVAGARAGGPGGQDYKSRLQELSARHFDEQPRYETLAEGPDHARRFHVTVAVGGEVPESIQGPDGIAETAGVATGTMGSDVHLENLADDIASRAAISSARFASRATSFSSRSANTGTSTSRPSVSS